MISLAYTASMTKSEFAGKQRNSDYVAETSQLCFLSCSLIERGPLKVPACVVHLWPSELPPSPPPAPHVLLQLSDVFTEKEARSFAKKVTDASTSFFTRPQLHDGMFPVFGKGKGARLHMRFLTPTIPSCDTDTDGDSGSVSSCSTQPASSCSSISNISTGSSSNHSGTGTKRKGKQKKPQQKKRHKKKLKSIVAIKPQPVFQAHHPFTIAPQW